MEIFTIQDFKDQKLDYFQKKTESEKCTVLVVCIDHGMCAAFHLPREDVKPEETDKVKEKISKSVIPPFKGKPGEYLSVKKSLDKVFPSSLGHSLGITNHRNNIHSFGTGMDKPSDTHSSGKGISEQGEAVRNITMAKDGSNYE